MSTSSFTGTIKNFSPKPDEDYYGILIDNGEEDKWLNGQGSPKDSWSKGDKVKVKANMDEFIEIQEIDVITGGGANEDGESREGDSAGAMEGSTANHSYIPPELQVAFKEACKDFREIEDEMSMEEERQFKSGKTAMHYEVLKQVGAENGEVNDR